MSSGIELARVWNCNVHEMIIVFDFMVDVGLSLSDLDLLTIGMVNELYAESSNAQTETVVENLLMDVKFQGLSAYERAMILDRLLSEIRGRMMEEIILLETKVAKKDKRVFKLQFPVGEFDMVVWDPRNLSCEIYEVKYSNKQVPNQYRYLIDEEKCTLVTHRYGEITGRYVIYRGESATVDCIQYINVEEYLKSL